VTAGFGAFLLRRLLTSLAFVAAVSAVALTLAHFAPIDPGMLEPGARDRIARERAELGLDRPLIVQLARFAGGVARLDLGTSLQFGQPVTDLLKARAPRTAELAGISLALATIIGLPLGLLTGARPRGWLAQLVTPLSRALVACPPIVGALALLWLGVSTGWLSVSPGALGPPALALALPLAAMLERLQSQATREAMSAADLLAAAARGIPPWRLLWVHAARQSLRPVLGIYGIAIGSLFSGSLAVEVVTAWPGLGRLMYDALVSRDVYLVTGCALLGASFLAVGNFLVDVARALVDPRVTVRA
jgi:ABC-type dipeptide/oligopeptide/nickel transport system permease component